MPNSHRDVWQQVAQALQHVSVAVLKMESHMSVPDALTAGFHPLVVMLNDAADVIADTFAPAVQIPEGEVNGLMWNLQIVRSIRQRLAATFVDATTKDQHSKPPTAAKIRRARIDRAAAEDATAHSLVDDVSHYLCTACKARVPKTVGLRWLATPCHPAESNGVIFRRVIKYG